MSIDTGTGRTIGAAMLAGALIEAWSNFGLQSGLFEGGGFLANAGGQPRTIGFVIVAGALAGLLALWVATALLVRLKAADPVLSRIYWILTAVALGTTLVELSIFIAMRDVSELFVAAGPDAGPTFEIARVTLRGLRNGLHFGTKTFEGVNLLMFYLLLMRARVVPLPLAGIGILASLLQLVAVGGPLFGGSVNYALLAPIGIVYLSTAAWILARGLSRPRGVAGVRADP